MAPSSMEEKIIKYWTDPTNPAAFSGLERFRDFLSSEKNIRISKTELYYILRKIPAYIKKIQPPKRFPRRHAEVSGSDLWWSADLCFFDGHQSACLVVIDVFNLKIWAVMVQDKKENAISKALEGIFRLNDGISPKKLETDGGNEFSSPQMKRFYEKHGIYHLRKYGLNKAFYAENTIGRIKKKVFSAQETGNASTPIAELVRLAVQSLNNTPAKRLGGLKPSEINHLYDDPKVRQLRNSEGPKQPTWQEMEKNQKKYESAGRRNPYQVGALVYHISEGRLQFQKTKKMGAIFRIREVRANESPPLYKLESLSGTPLKRWYYKPEIQFANIKPQQRIYEIEKIVKQRTYRKKLQYLVKYKNYKQLYVSIKIWFIFITLNACVMQ